MHTMADFTCLFALGRLEIIIFIVVFIIPLISQMLGGGKKAKEARRKQQQPRPRPQQEPLAPAPQQGAPPQPAPQQGGGRNALEAEIEEFLSRAQGAKRQQPAKKVQPHIEKPEEKPRRLVPARTDSATQTASHEKELGRDVAEHVRDHIQSDPVGEHAKQLGHDIGQADENLEDHIHDVFDHRLGKLSKQPTEDSPTEGTDSEVWQSTAERRERSEAAHRSRIEDIAKMLRDPESMQQAIILSEILRRPE
jgi:hypothetical protein